VIRFWFEIVRRAFGRFSWEFVAVGGGTRRVHARAGRDFGSKKQARKAVRTIQAAVAGPEMVTATLKAFQEVIVGAEIIDATGDEDSFDFAASNFEIAPDAVPLVVAQSFAQRTRGNGQRRRSRIGGSRQDWAVHLALEGAAPPADLSAEAPVQSAAGDTAKPTTTASPRAANKADPAAKKAATGASATTASANKASRGSASVRASRTR
jgi:hypothetical protein